MKKNIVPTAKGKKKKTHQYKKESGTHYFQGAKFVVSV